MAGRLNKLLNKRGSQDDYNLIKNKSPSDNKSYISTEDRPFKFVLKDGQPDLLIVKKKE